MYKKDRENSSEAYELVSNAARAMRAEALSPDALFRAEAKIMSRLPIRRQIPRRVFYWAAGFGTAALAFAIVLAPSKSFAAELRRIAENGDAAVRHVVDYEVHPDGSLTVSRETYADGTHTRFIDSFANQFTYVNGRVTYLHPDGSVTIESQKSRRRAPTRASEIVALDVNNERMTNILSSIKRSIQWHGATVDEYVVDGTFRDGQNIERKSHLLLIADPATERPIEIDSTLEGLSSSVSKWDYPTLDPKLFELPITAKNPVYDIDAERAAVMTALATSGPTATVGGKQVELLQLWVDAGGQACAITRADYAYPVNFGVEIDDLQLNTGPVEESESMHYMNVAPTLYDGRSVQLFFTDRAPNAGPVKFNDHVTVRVPVFYGYSFQGYVRFENVPVHRAWNLYFLLRPRNVPFWLDGKTMEKITPTTPR